MANLNMKNVKAPLPVVVRIYLFSYPKVFKHTTFTVLWINDLAVHGNSLLRKDSVTLDPASHQKIRIAPHYRLHDGLSTKNQIEYRPYPAENPIKTQEVNVMIKLLVVVGTLMIVGLAAPPAQAEDVLTGDKKLACEALLCLSSPDRPSECSPALSHYFSIRKFKWKDTVKARRKFLNKCPNASQDKEMKSRITNISKNARQWNIDWDTNK